MLSPTLLLTVFAITAGLTDLLTRRIPNWLTLPALLIGIALHPWVGIQGAAVALAIAVPLYLLNASGGGDLKMMAAAGALAGPGQFLVIFVINAILGGIAALGLALAKGRLRATLRNLTRLNQLDVRDPDALTIPRGTILGVSILLTQWAML